MCFAPQRRAIFRHLKFKKWPEHVVFWGFWLANVLRATAACHFLTLELPKSVPRCGVLCILTCKCASRHSGVPFFRIRTSKIGPSLWCFVHFDLKMCFAPQRRAIFHFSAEQLPPHLPLYRAYFSNTRTTNHWKNTAIRDIPNISRVCIFFLVTLLARWSSFCWLYSRVDLLSAGLTSCWSSFCGLDFSTLLFNCPYCRKLDF